MGNPHVHFDEANRPKVHFDPLADLHQGISKRASALGDKLRGMPQAAADALMNLDRGFSARRLTPEEVRLVTRAWSNEVDPVTVRIVDGPGFSDVAAAAFLNGNPAITIGNTIYMKPSQYLPNFGLNAEDAALLVHEYTHVIQWKLHGYVKFLRRYGVDYCRHGFNAKKMYAFHERRTTFAQESLEGQAEMVGLYTLFLHTKTAHAKEQVARIEPRLKGSKAYGF